MVLLTLGAPALADDMPKITVSPQMDAVTIEDQWELSRAAVHTATDPNQWNASFEKDAKSYGINIRVASCEVLVNFSHAYGAYCALTQDNKQARVEMCDNDTVDHFVIKWAPSYGREEPDKKELIRFTAANCVGG